MILYDSQRWTNLIRIRGSVFPRAVLLALPSAGMAALIKFLEAEGIFGLSSILSMMPSNSVYSGFTFVLGFVLVFRASQSYARYWLAATSVHLMQAEWFHACSSLIAFSKVSKKKQEEVTAFAHTCIRLFCLLHAMALEEIADLTDENFPLLDIQGFSQEDVRILCSERAAGRKVELVFQWIQAYIVKSLDSDLLNVPSPIVTRVFQNLGNGLINYNSAQQVVIWPFPFAYAQMNGILIFVYMMLTPIVMCNWTGIVWSCALFTFVSVLCMVGLDLIAIELENPFGDDPNDLPVWEMQNVFNRDLVMLVDPLVWTVPKLLPRARGHAELMDCGRHESLSLEEYERSQQHTGRRKGSKTGALTKQMAWAEQAFRGQAGHASVLKITSTNADDIEDLRALSVDPKDDGMPAQFSSGSDEMPAKRLDEFPVPSARAAQSALHETLQKLLQDQDVLLQQQREFFQQHLQQESQFLERLLSIFEPARSSDTNSTHFIPDIPVQVAEEMHRPRGTSLWPCDVAGPRHGHLASRTALSCQKLQAVLQAQQAQCPPG
uniref:Bestrophin homolog n=1 Tax=Pyrodinium bahamense TaxID=73915 RepID=A0A7S0BCW3_9DINO|mmetsp:Transcript_8955/g.24883  ORF Transcript_8955/g.24883 Transcript_8955/m.24883 type:complete len:549 (+) Transcript_8955:87-1733(+)